MKRTGSIVAFEITLAQHPLLASFALGLSLRLPGMLEHEDEGKQKSDRY